MEKIPCLILAVCIGPLTGCSSIPDKLAESTAIEWPWPDNKPGDNAQAEYLKATAYCVKLQQYYAAGGSSGKAAKFGLAALGTLAGAVFAPIATGSAAIAWSGFSGATNALQISYDQSFDYALVTARRAQIQREMEKGQDAYAEKPTVLSAINLASRCAMAPAQVDQAFMATLNDLRNSGKKPEEKQPEGVKPPATPDKK
ncbi:hypothetical protein ACET8K_03660 [Aeromonas veronii]|uniref:hypothetical protein n=1 Tax=Aeromonas veronii TaxID=654 RepID=UPI0038EFF305